MKRYYVMATLGAAPAVLTELLWTLVMGEDAEVVGLEVWTTGGGPPAPRLSGQWQLEQFDDKGAWAKLVAALGVRSDRVPRLRDRVARDEVARRIGRGERTFCLEVFHRGGEALADVRNSEDAEAMDIELYERVRWLRLNLPTDVVLIGSLAGGRKTMSAALQAAFTLQAGPHDRLVHVLLHPRIELSESPNWREYVVPGPEWGVPVNEQITLHDVWFPRLRTLFAQATLEGGGSLLHVLDHDAYSELVRGLRQASVTEARAWLRRESSRRWVYRVRAGVFEQVFDLSSGEGELLATLALSAGGMTARAIHAWWVERGLVEELGDLEEAHERAENIVRTRVRRARQRLAVLGARGLGAFVPAGAVRETRSYRLAAAGRIEVDPRDLVR